MKKRTGVGVVVGLAITGMGLTALTGYVSNNYLKTNTEKTTTTESECKYKRQNHVIAIEGNKMTPEHTKAELCDTLTVVNKDLRQRLMAFGVHSSHIQYDGVGEKLLQTDESFSITFDRIGTYKIHDHYQDEVKGDFTVTY